MQHFIFFMLHLDVHCGVKKSGQHRAFLHGSGSLDGDSADVQYATEALTSES